MTATTTEIRTIAILPSKSFIDATKPFDNPRFTAGMTLVVTLNDAGKTRALAGENDDLTIGEVVEAKHATRGSSYGPLKVVAKVAADGTVTGELPTGRLALRFLA